MTNGTLLPTHIIYIYIYIFIIRHVRLVYKPYFFNQRIIFSLTTNQPTVLSVMAYQPSEQGNNYWKEPTHIVLLVLVSKM